MMIRRIILSLIFGASLGVIAARYSGTAAGVAAGILSTIGFWVGSTLVRSRLRAKQGVAPSMSPGEVAVLYGPCSILAKGAAPQPAWAYLSNFRLRLRGEGDSLSVDLALKDIEELRPTPKGVMVVSKSQGSFDLALPDAKRWLSALRSEARS